MTAAGVDPVAALAAAVERDLPEDGGALRDGLLRWFDELDAHERRTPHMTPTDDLVARLLRAHFPDPRAPRIVALFLFERTDWPAWRRQGVTEFLGVRADPATLPALVRVAIADADDRVRELAVAAMDGFEAADLVRALAAEGRYRAVKAGVRASR